MRILNHYTDLPGSENLNVHESSVTRSMRAGDDNEILEKMNYRDLREYLEDDPEHETHTLYDYIDHCIDQAMDEMSLGQKLTCLINFDDKYASHIANVANYVLAKMCEDSLSEHRGEYIAYNVLTDYEEYDLPSSLITDRQVSRDFLRDLMQSGFDLDYESDVREFVQRIAARHLDDSSEMIDALPERERLYRSCPNGICYFHLDETENWTLGEVSDNITDDVMYTYSEVDAFCQEHPDEVVDSLHELDYEDPNIAFWRLSVDDIAESCNIYLPTVGEAGDLIAQSMINDGKFSAECTPL